MTLFKLSIALPSAATAQKTKKQQQSESSQVPIVNAPPTHHQPTAKKT